MEELVGESKESFKTLCRSDNYGRREGRKDQVGKILYGAILKKVRPIERVLHLAKWTCFCGAQSLSRSSLGLHMDSEGAVVGAVSQLCSLEI